MKILEMKRDFRGWPEFLIKCNNEEKVYEFVKLLKTGSIEVSCMKYLNTTNLYEITILPNEVDEEEDVDFDNQLEAAFK